MQIKTGFRLEVYCNYQRDTMVPAAGGQRAHRSPCRAKSMSRYKQVYWQLYQVNVARRVSRDWILERERLLALMLDPCVERILDFLDASIDSERWCFNGNSSLDPQNGVLGHPTPTRG